MSYLQISNHTGSTDLQCHKTAWASTQVWRTQMHCNTLPTMSLYLETTAMFKLI